MYFTYKNNLKIIFSALLISMSASSHAVDFAAETGLQFGGDTLYTAVFVDGETRTISAGDGIQFSIGAKFDVSDTTFIKALVGISNSNITATNGSIDWDYTPVNVMFYKKVNRWKFGGGITLHMDPSLTGSGVASGSADFDDSIGYSVQADHDMGKKGYYGFKYTIMSYSQSTGGTFNGNSFGLVVGGYF